MVRTAIGATAHQLSALYEAGSMAGLSDRQLLDRFVADRRNGGEAAFTALVDRHGPMVLDVCRQLLGDAQHAEDAFQAVFMVLAKKAPSIRDPDLLGNWLYGVAIRTARCASHQIARRRRREENPNMKGPRTGDSDRAELTAPPADRPAIDREEAAAIHGAIARLPRAFRLPVVLCYFEGLTLDEAARRLSCPAGTLRSRLARARDKLRVALSKKGITLPAALLAAEFAPRPGAAAVPQLLCNRTTRIAIDFASHHAAVTGPAAILAQEVIHAMFFHKLKAVFFSLCVFACLATGAGWLAFAGAAKAELGLAVAANGVASPPTNSEEATPPQPAPVPKMTVTGRVLDPGGKPVANASVLIYAHILNSLPTTPSATLYPEELGRTTSDASGQFRLEVPRTSSSRYDEFGAVARANGFGVGWVDALDPDAHEPSAEITLRVEHPIEGRLFDLQGQPATGVKLSVTAIGRIGAMSKPRRLQRERYAGPVFWWNHADDLAGWPLPAITDTDGRFVLRNIGKGETVALTVLDPRFMNQGIEIDTNTDRASQNPSLTFAVQPARSLIGRVTYADTGKPAAKARVVITGFDQFQAGVGPRPIVTETDADGRYRASPGPGSTGIVTAYSPAGAPYLSNGREVPWPKGSLTISADLTVPRGAIIRGKVVQQGAREPIADATVTFIARRVPNERQGLRTNTPARTAADGSFELVAPTRQGHLVVHGPDDTYVMHEESRTKLLTGELGGARVYAHAFVAFEPKASTEVAGTAPLTIEIRRGSSVSGRVIGQNDRPVPVTWLISRIHLNEGPAPLWSWVGDTHGSTHDGNFELHGLDPDSETPVSFFEPKSKLGTTIRFRGNSLGTDPIVVKLAPCATATARLVGSDGKPLGNFTPRAIITMVVTPGEFDALKSRQEGTLRADASTLDQIDPLNYGATLTTDAAGRITFPVLIPGATYRLLDFSSISASAGGPKFRKEFTVKPGETSLDLGDILIEKGK